MEQKKKQQREIKKNILENSKFLNFQTKPSSLPFTDQQAK